MDSQIQKKLEEKIEETVAQKKEIFGIIESLKRLDKSKSFALGLIVGRLYNSFFYQSRRILGRDPTDKEFSEFLDFLDENKDELIKRLSL